jgi:hypothetical protein
MTLDPISSAQCASILKQMRRTGKWGGRKCGRMVRLWRHQTEEGVKIGYQVSLKMHTQVHGTAFSVAAAVEAVNRILQPRPSTPIVAPRLPAERRREAANFQWLPYKDTEL